MVGVQPARHTFSRQDFELTLNEQEQTMSAKGLGGTEGKTIKRLLRHRESLAYFKDGGWTDNPREAKCFADVVEAARVCAEHGLEDVELALRYEAADEDVFCTQIR